MNRIFFVVLFSTLGVFSTLSAQKFGYVDMDFITSKMPAYKKIGQEMDQFSEKWVKEIGTKYDELDKMKKTYQLEEILLTDEMRRERQKAIEDKERSVKELNNKVFSTEGLIFQKKKELMKPIFEEIYKAVEKVAVKQRLMFLFDKAADMTMVYTDPRHDYSDFVIEELGLNKEETKPKQPKN